MTRFDRKFRSRRALISAAAVPVLVAGVLAVGDGSAAASSGAQAAAKQGPCDLYAQGGTPCVAAHSTTRALYAAYDGPLYQVTRASDGATFDVRPISKGSYADAKTQDSFCAATSCAISVIYDQSGHGNNLTQAPPGGFSGPEAGGYDKLADATAAPVLINGHKVYGVKVTPGTGYRDNNTSGIATGDDPEGEYALLDGTQYNRGCCFDYGNAETDSHDDGNGTMEAIYFGNSPYWGSGAGAGPWIMADQENGLFSGVQSGQNVNDPSVRDRFLTAMVDGGHDEWSIRGGNAQTGQLTTYYHGVRPSAAGYNPMKKQGAIILGIGGDNSVSATGTFYEGAMTSGYPSEATENAVQANLAGTRYTAPEVPLQAGTKVYLEATGPGEQGKFMTADVTNDAVDVEAVTTSSPAAIQQAAQWVETPGLADSSCVSLESAANPGYYLRHYGWVAKVEPNDTTTQYAQDATFCPQAGNSGIGTSFQSVNYPTRYLRDYQGAVDVASNGGWLAWDDPTDWAADSSWLVDSTLP